MVGPGPFDDNDLFENLYDDEEEDLGRTIDEIDPDEYESNTRQPIYQLDEEQSFRPDNPVSGSLVNWNISNSPVEKFFQSVESNFGGDPNRFIRKASQDFNNKFAALDLQTQQRALGQFVQTQADRLRATTSSFDELVASSSHGLTSPTGFLRRPSEKTYYNLLATEQAQPMGLRMTYFQMQQRDVMQALENRRSSVEILAQGFTPRTAINEEAQKEQRTRMDIALGNLISKQALESGNAGHRKSYDLVNLDGASFHPKMAYEAADVIVGDFDTAEVETPKTVIFGTQNITNALAGRSTSEEVLVLNREVAAYHPLMREIRAATDALLETQRQLHKSELPGKEFRAKASQTYSEILNKRQGYVNSRFVSMNQDVQLRLKGILENAVESGSKVVLSIQYLENLFRESPADASVYGDFQRSMRGLLENLAEGGRLKVAMQTGRMGNRAGFFQAMDDLLDNPQRSDDGASLLRTLLKTDSISFAPTSFMHSKSLAVFNQRNELSAFGMMSANISRFAAEKNVEVGLFIEGGDREGREALLALDNKGAISDYYLNVMSAGLLEDKSHHRRSRFLSELKANPSMVSSAYKDFKEMERQLGGVSVNRRYRLAEPGEKTTPERLLTGLDISINDRNRNSPFEFSVSIGSEFTPAGEMPVVYLNEDSRMIVGGVYTNRSKYTVEIHGRRVAPGESVRLDAIQVLQGLVKTIHRGIEFESTIRWANEAYGRSFGGNKQSALNSLNRVLSETFMTATQIVAGGGFKVTGEHDLYDTLKTIRTELGRDIYGQVVSKSRSILERFADTYGEDMSERLKLRLTSEREKGLASFFEIFDEGEPSRVVLQNALSDLESIVGDDKFGGRAFSDIRRRMVDVNPTASALYKEGLPGRAREVMKQISASFFAPHETSFSASQVAAALPTYSITDDIIQSMDDKAMGQQVIRLDAAVLNPDLLRHGMRLGEKGQYVRGIAATATTNEYDIYRSLGGILKAEGGAARVYDTQSLFQMMPSLGIIRKGQLSEEISQLRGNEILQRKIQELEDELFQLNESSAMVAQRTDILMLLPYSKTEQISQRLKNLTSTRPTFDVSNDQLNFLLNLGIGTKRTPGDMLIGADSLTGAVKTSLPEYQYKAMKAFIDTLDPALSAEDRERAVLQHFRQNLLDPTAVNRGVIGASAPRRVLHNIGISTMSDFGYINSGYDKDYGYSHRVKVTFNPKMLGEGQDVGTTVSKIERALGAGVFAVGREMQLGNQANEALQRRFESIRSKLSNANPQLSSGHVRALALAQLRERYGRLNIHAENINDLTTLKASLMPGMYRIDPEAMAGREVPESTMLNPELVGEFTGTATFNLVGVETYKGGRRSPIRVRMPAFSRREYEGITAFIGKVSSNVESGRVTLQADTLNLMKFRSGLRPGEAAAKGPMLAIESDFFDMYNEIAQAKLMSGGVTHADMLPQRVRNEQIFAMLPRSAVKGFNYESGLALIEDVDEPGIMKMMQSSTGGETVAQALGTMLLGNKDVREAMASSLGRRSTLYEMAVRQMSGAPKGLKDIDTTLSGGGGAGVKKMALVAGGLYSLADVREGEDLHTSLERTVREALEIDKETGDYTSKALRSQELLQERAVELFSTVRSEKYSTRIGNRLVFEEKGPVVKAASLLAYLTSASQQMFGSPNGTFQYGDRPLIELNLNPYYKGSPDKENRSLSGVAEVVQKRISAGADPLVLEREIEQLEPLAKLASEASKAFRSHATASEFAIESAKRMQNVMLSEFRDFKNSYTGDVLERPKQMNKDRVLSAVKGELESLKEDNRLSILTKTDRRNLNDLFKEIEEASSLDVVKQATKKLAKVIPQQTGFSENKRHYQEVMSQAQDRFGVDVDAILGSKRFDRESLKGARQQARRLSNLAPMVNEVKEVIDVNSTPVTRFIVDPTYRDSVQGIAQGLGVQLPSVDNFQGLTSEQKQELRQELEVKMQYMYSIFQTNRPIEMMMELSPSKSLVAAGMQDVAKFEYQYTTALTQEALSQYIADPRTKDTVTDLQSAVLIISEAMSPSTRRRGAAEIKQQAVDFTMVNLIATEQKYGSYGRGLIAASQIVEGFSPITHKQNIRLGKSTTILEDVVRMYAGGAELEQDETFRMYKNVSSTAAMDIGVSPGDVAKRAELLGRIEAAGLSYTPQLGELTDDLKKRYLNSFYDTLTERSRLARKGTRGSLIDIDERLSRENPLYKVVMDHVGRNVKRIHSKEGQINTKEALFDLFERNRVWDVMQEASAENIRGSILNVYSEFERIEFGRYSAMASAGKEDAFKRRSIMEALGSEQTLRDTLRRYPVASMFLEDKDAGIFGSEIYSREDVEVVEKKQRKRIVSRIKERQNGMLAAINEGLQQESGSNYLRALESVRSAATDRLRAPGLKEQERSRLLGLKQAVEKTEYLQLPSFDAVGEKDGRLALRQSNVEAPTLGVRLGLDVLQRMSLVFPDYTSDILLNQQRMEELRRQAQPILNRFQSNKPQLLNSDEVEVIKELRSVMSQSTEDLKQLATMDTVRQMMGDRLQARGATFVPVSTFLAGRQELGAGHRLSRAAGVRGQSGSDSAGFGRLLSSSYQAITISTGSDRKELQRQLADTLNRFNRDAQFTAEWIDAQMYANSKKTKFVDADQFGRRVVSKIMGEGISRSDYHQKLADLEDKFYLGTVLANRSGAPAMIATTTAGTPLEVITVDEIRKRAKHESTYLTVDPKMGSTALMISAMGHQFTELGDYDGDTFQVVLTDIARLTSEISKSNEELLLVQRRLGERLADDREQQFLLSQKREILSRIGRTNLVLQEKLRTQDEIRKRSAEEGRSGVMQMVSAYTGLPSELFGRDRPIGEVRSMSLIQQYRDTLSGLYDNAKHLGKGNEVIEAMSKAKSLRISGDRIEGLDYSGLDESLVKNFVQYAKETGRLQEGETNMQSIVKEFSTVQGSISNLQASMSNLNKGLENLQGQVLAPNMFEDIQGAVGFAGSSLLGKTYNTIIPLMYSMTQELAVQRALSREGPGGAFKEKLLQNLRAIGASEESIKAAQNIAVGEAAARQGQGAMGEVERSLGFLGTMQQMMRDALKPKGDGGIGDQMQQFGLESKLSAAIDDQQRVGVMREFVLSQIGSSIDLPVTRGGPDSISFRKADRQRDMNATSFGLMYTLAEYVKAESMDDLLGYSSGGRKASVFSRDLRDAYERYKQDHVKSDPGAQLMNTEDFMANLLAKNIAAAQANFTAFNVMADTPDTKGLIKGINEFYVEKEAQLRQKIASAGDTGDRDQFSRELQLASKYRLALESDGDDTEKLSRVIYLNLTEGGSGINERHVKYMREFGQMSREIMLNKDLSSALSKNLEMAMVAAGSMIQRGKAEAETLAGMMGHIQSEISSKISTTSMPELEGLDEGARAAVLYQRGYMRALDPESMFPELGKLPEAMRSQVKEDFIRAMTMPITDEVDPGQTAKQGDETELSSNRMTTNLTKFLGEQITAYELSMGLSSKLQALKQEERLALDTGDFEAAQVASDQAKLVQEQQEAFRGMGKTKRITPADYSAYGPILGDDASDVNRQAAESTTEYLRNIDKSIEKVTQQRAQQVEMNRLQTEQEVETTLIRNRKRNEFAEIAGLLAGPLVFGMSQGDIKLDERAALFGLDVIQSMTSLAQFEDSVVSTKLIGTKAGDNYHDKIHRQAREAAVAFRYKRIANLQEGAPSSIEGTLQGLAAESLYQIMNQGVSRAANALEESAKAISQTVVGRGAIGAASEIIGGVLAMSASRALLGEPVTPREAQIQDEVEQILRYYSVAAYTQAEIAFMERLKGTTISAEESATGEDLSTDINTDGAPTEFELGLEMGTIAYDEEDAHLIEFAYGVSEEDSFSPVSSARS